MKSFSMILCGLLLSASICAEKQEILFQLILTPLSSKGIQIDSTKLILLNSDSIPVDQFITNKDTIFYLFDSLNEGKYFLTVQLYQQDYILIESLSSGYLHGISTREIRGSVFIECAYPVLHVNWNPGISFDGNDFYDYAIEPDSNFLRCYYLDSLDSLSTAFLDSGMHYYQEYPVHWELLDSNLIPIIHYSFGDYRNPVTTCHTAFAFYDELSKNNDSINYAGFINNANWLLDNCDSNYYLHYEFNFTHGGEVLPAGWVSGMAQGLALAVLSMACDLTGEQKYLDGADGIFTTMYKNSGNYWCIGVDEKDYYWLEEYPCSRFCHVFNGMVSGLWGLWCYYTITGDHFAGIMLEAGIKSVVDNYPQWNCPNQDLSYYCLHYNKNINYHNKHILQLRYFGDYFGIAEFHQAADCFSNKYFAAYPRSLTLSPEEDTAELKLFSTLSWNVNADHEWLSVQGIGNELDVLCNENPSYQCRTANISFTGSGDNVLQVIPVKQHPVRSYSLADMKIIKVSPDSGQIWFEVDIDNMWTVKCDHYWIKSSKVNDTMLLVKYMENTSSRRRTANLEVYIKD
ncbi:MAG: hypothetical protein AMS27_01815, partial [Bacteroides sp. SM23_62_1]